MPVNLQADLKNFDKELERLADLHPEVAGKTLRRQVVLLAIDIMERTPPGIGSGLSPNARQEGAARVKRDIYSIYPLARKLSAGGIAASGDFGAFRKWALAVSGNVPASLRDYVGAKTGRPDVIDKIVNGRSQKDFEQFLRLMTGSYTPKSVNILPNFSNANHIAAKDALRKNPQGPVKSSDYFVKTNGIASYTKSVQARVGKLKAGWFAAIRSLPEAKNHRKIPAWIKKAMDDSSGYSEDYSNAPKMVASVAIANRIADKNGVSTRVAAVANALQYRARMMRREYAEALNDLARKAGRK